MTFGVVGDFKERHEQVVKELLEVDDETVRLVDVTARRTWSEDGAGGKEINDLYVIKYI